MKQTVDNVQKRKGIFSPNLKEVKVVNLCCSIAGLAAISPAYQDILLNSYVYGHNMSTEVSIIIQVVFLLFLVIIYSNFNYRFLVKTKVITSRRSDIIQLTLTPLVFIALSFIVAQLVIFFFY